MENIFIQILDFKKRNIMKYIYLITSIYLLI